MSMRLRLQSLCLRSARSTPVEYSKSSCRSVLQSSYYLQRCLGERLFDLHRLKLAFTDTDITPTLHALIKTLLSPHALNNNSVMQSLQPGSVKRLGLVGHQLQAFRVPTTAISSSTRSCHLVPCCTKFQQQRQQLSCKHAPNSNGLQLLQFHSRRTPSVACNSTDGNRGSTGNSSSSSSGGGGGGSGFTNPGKDSVDLGLSIFEASDWQQLYELFYDYHNTPSYQHCYSILMQLAELLPELQQQPGGGPGLGFGAGSDIPAVPYNSRLGGSSSDGNSSGGWEAVWQSLSAGGKVQSWTQLSRLRALIRDVLRAIQVQLHCYQPQELVEVLEAALQLTRPSALWMQAWQATIMPHLKQLQLQQLMRAATGLLSYGHNPTKPWAGLWFVALQKHLPQCNSHDLAIVSLALKTWGCRPPLSWVEPYMEGLQVYMTNMTSQEFLAVIGAAVTLHLKPSSGWLQGFESASQGLLVDCSASELALLIQGLWLLGHNPSGSWLQNYLAAVHAELADWDLESLGSMLVVLGQLQHGQEAVQKYDIGQSNSSCSSTDGSSSSSSSGSGLLGAIAAHAEPLIETTDNPGALVKLLRGFHSLDFTPSDPWLDLLLDEAAEKISVNSRRSRAKFFKNVSGNSVTGSSSDNSTSSFDNMGRIDKGRLGAAGNRGSGSSSSSSSDSVGSDTADAYAEDDPAEQAWELAAGLYNPNRNINLARRNLESSWLLDSLEEDGSSSSTDSNSGSSSRPGLKRQNSSGLDAARSASSSSSSGGATGLYGPGGLAAGSAAAAAGAAPGVQSLAASSVVVGHVLGLLTVVAAMELPVERTWVADVMKSLQGHCRVIDLPELQQLLALLELYGPVLDPEAVDELLVQCHVDYSKLAPQDTLRLLKLLAASQTRPNNIWWQGFLATLQDSLPKHEPAQLVLLLTSMCEMGGRPPQAWLAAHESALLDANARSGSTQALNPQGWLLLLECYSKLMYQPSEDFESAFERYILGVLPQLKAKDLASLVGSVGRLQLPVSPQLEDGTITRLEQVLPSITRSELQQLVQGLLLMDVQLPSSCLRGLCHAAQPYLANLKPQAACCLLQLISKAGDYPPSPGWLTAALDGIEPQLDELEALGALMLLQSLRAFHATPSPRFMSALQDRLLLLLPKFDAMGVVTMFQGLMSCGSPPNPALQAVLAGHIKKGLARPSQGMGGTPVWLCLECVLQMHDPPAIAALLDELLLQVSQQLRKWGPVSSSKMVQRLLPQLAAAITRGGVWGSESGYNPNPGFCHALCAATLEDPSRLDHELWLDLLIRFGDLAGSVFKPNKAWCRVATQQVYYSWGSQVSTEESNMQQQQQLWEAAPPGQLAALLGAVGRLQHVPSYLPGWPEKALQQLCCKLGQLNGHQLSVVLLGVAQQLALAEMATAAAAAAAAASPGAGLLDSSMSVTSISSVGSSSNSSRDDVYSTNSSSSSSSVTDDYKVGLHAYEAAKPQLVAAAEAASLAQLAAMDGNDLAMLAHALQQLGHMPSPDWVDEWAAAAAVQLPGASGQSGVLMLAAAAGFEARPNPSWLQLLLQHCQQHLAQLQLGELVALARALQLLGYRLDEVFVRQIAKAGQARMAVIDGGEAAAAGRQLFLELQQLLPRLLA